MSRTTRAARWRAVCGILKTKRGSFYEERITAAHLPHVMSALEKAAVDYHEEAG